VGPGQCVRDTLETGCMHTVLSYEHGQGETQQGMTVMSWYPRRLESRWFTVVQWYHCAALICQLDDFTSRNACEHSVTKSESDWVLGVLDLHRSALQNGSPGNCNGWCSCSSDTEEHQNTVLGTFHLQLQIVKSKILHCTKIYVNVPLIFLFILTYLLHGAESFLRS
jgi:hypothetical protein